MPDSLVNYVSIFGLGGLAGGLLVEALGLPFPGGLMIIFVGFLVNQGRLSFYSVFVTAVFSFNLGAVGAYFIGRRLEGDLLERLGKILRINNQKWEKAQGWMRQSAPLFIIVGRFVPMVSNLTPYMAGMSGLKLPKFLLYNMIFTIIWVLFNLTLGLLFGSQWSKIAEYINGRLPLAALALGIAYIVVRLALNLGKQKGRQKPS